MEEKTMIEEIRNVRKVKEDEREYFERLLLKKQKKKKTSSRVKLKCGIYARKSQEDKRDTSLNAQINYCKTLISTCDTLELVEIYQEDDVSGMWDDRAEFQKLIKDVKDEVIDVIVVYKWDRFSRKSSDMQDYYMKVISYNGYVLAGDSSYVIDNATALYHMQMAWTDNEKQARETAENTMNSFMGNFYDKNTYLARKTASRV